MNFRSLKNIYDKDGKFIISKKKLYIVSFLVYFLTVIGSLIFYNDFIKLSNTIKLTDSLSLEYKSNIWKINKKGQDNPNEIFRLNGINNPRVVDIKLFDNDNENLKEKTKLTEELISKSGGIINISEEKYINGMTYYILGYSLLVNDYNVYTSSFSTLSPKEDKVVILKITGINEMVINKNLEDFMNNLSTLP